MVLETNQKNKDHLDKVIAHASVPNVYVNLHFQKHLCIKNLCTGVRALLNSVGGQWHSICLLVIYVYVLHLDICVYIDV